MAVSHIRRHCEQAVARRLNGERAVGLYLSGGIDSAAVAWWLQKAGVGIEAFSLDFGERSVEKPQAVEVAKRVGAPLHFLPVGGEQIFISRTTAPSFRSRATRRVRLKRFGRC